MSFLKLVFLLLHVITAAAWFGLALRLSGMARRIGGLRGEAAKALADCGARDVRLLTLSLLLTFAFAMGLLALGRGYPGQMEYHIASALIVVLVGVHFFLIRPAWKGLSAAAASQEGTHVFQKRIAGATGLGHLIWLTLLILMFWRRFEAVL